MFAHVKTSAVYCFADPYRKKRLRLEVVLTPKLAQKRAFAADRRENRLNRKFPWRKQLLADLSAQSAFLLQRDQSSHSELPAKTAITSIALVSAIDVARPFCRVSERGQITTSIGSCPRDLQPHLLLDGEPTCFLRHFKRALEFPAADPGKPP